MEHLEGRHSVMAALRARQRRFNAILLRHGIHQDQFQELLDLATQMNVPIRYADPHELDALSHGGTHGGVIAIVSPKPRTPIDQLCEMIDRGSTAPLILLLEGIEDARNLGFVLRSAAALGVHAVMIKKHLWDFDSADIARSSSGAFETLPIVQIDETTSLQVLQKRGIQLIGCLAGAKKAIYDADLTKGTILAVGGEKRGLSGAVRSICDSFVTIPTLLDAPSLSLSHAAAIVMAEAHRQRLST